MSSEKFDLVVQFDTTGSMYPVLAQVRNVVRDFVRDMFKEFTDLRIGIIAHGDYCDKDDPYTIIYKELSRDVDAITDFVQNVKSTYGGDADECYELALHLCGSDDLGWREDANKILVVIGDASPHAPSYRDNVDNLDWRVEADNLARKGVKIFAVHALAGFRSSSRGFYKTIAEKTLGVYLTLDMFSEIIDLIKATVCQQDGMEKLNDFVTIIRDSGKLTSSMDRNIRRLRGEKVEDEYESYGGYCGSSRRSSRRSSSGEVTLKEMDGLVPVVPGRFQVMHVDENCDIKGFVTKNGITFKKGRGFYELSKAETVQQYKEVIMQDLETGEMFNGSQVREKLGLQPQSEKGGVNERLRAAAAKDFRVFVQSTSVNRKLIKGTTFLYEVDDLIDEGTVIEEEPVGVVSTVGEKSETKAETKAETSAATETGIVEKEPTEEPKRKSTKKKKAETEEKAPVAETKVEGTDGVAFKDIESPLEDVKIAPADVREKAIDPDAVKKHKAALSKEAKAEAKAKAEASAFKARYGFTEKQLDEKISRLICETEKLKVRAEAFKSKKTSKNADSVVTRIEALEKLADVIKESLRQETE